MTGEGRLRRRGRFAAFAGALALAFTLGALAAGAAFSKPGELPEAPEPLIVTATPITQFRPHDTSPRFGPLTFLGGLVLRSSYPAFGGISAFTLGEGDRFLAVTDAGVFLAGKLDLDGDRPTGLSDVTAAALKDDYGRLMAQHGRGDAESVAVAPDGIYVGLESVNEIWRFPRPPLGSWGRSVPVPPGVRQLRFNIGLESLTYVPSGALKGALIAIGEDGIKAGEDLPGFIIGGPSPGRFTITKSGPFNATDAGIGADGFLYLLERHFSIATGVLMQVRRFPLADVKPGAVLTGSVLGTFDMGYEIDNMEGLAVTTNAAGETLLTMISDDNFSPIQRTVLLRFAVQPAH